MSFLIFDAIYCFSGGCLFVCFFSQCKLQFSGGIFFLSSSIMSLDKLESFPISFIGNNYLAWEFKFKLFVKGKELWGHIDGNVPAPQGAEALSKWETHDARVMTWLLSSVESHLVLNLRPYKTVAAMWTYLNTFTIKTTLLNDFIWSMRWLISHKVVSLLRNIFLIFKLFGLTIATLFMLMFPLQLSLLFEKSCHQQARSILDEVTTRL